MNPVNGTGTGVEGLFGPNLIPNVLAALFLIFPLLVCIRAYYLYSQSRSPRLFVLALAMGLVALTSADNLVANIITIPFNTYWFLYLGQTVGFFLIFLSLIQGSDEYLQKLTRWSILAAVLTLGLLVLAPVMPPFPNDAVRAAVNISRGVVTFGVFFCYTYAFMKKETRFSFLMGVAFLLVTFGILISAEKYLSASPDLLDNVGDITRCVGLFVLLIAVILG
jgi:hypothetical protein